jgi:hypothetical protein
MVRRSEDGQSYLISLCFRSSLSLGSGHKVPSAMYHETAAGCVLSRLSDAMIAGGSLTEFNGKADHVHAPISIPPNTNLSRFVNNLKTTSAHLLRRAFEATSIIYTDGSRRSGRGHTASSVVAARLAASLKSTSNSKSSVVTRAVARNGLHHHPSSTKVGALAVKVGSSAPHSTYQPACFVGSDFRACSRANRGSALGAASSNFLRSLRLVALA